MINKNILNGFLLSACSIMGGTSHAVCTLKVDQAPPVVLDKVDLGASGDSDDDSYFYDANITYQGLSGKLNVMTTIMEMPISGVQPSTNELRSALMFFLFNQADQLIVEGIGSYPQGSLYMKPDSPVVRAVVGGTGRFKFIRGEVKTTRNVDGSYIHEFELDSHSKTCKF